MDKIDETYWKNKRIQTKLHMAILEVIPADVLYANIIVVLVDLLRTFTNDAFHKDIYGVKKRA